MKKLGFSKFEVEIGEEVELKITPTNVARQRPTVHVDGQPIEPSVSFDKATTYNVMIGLQEGELHECTVRLPDSSFDDAAIYKLELFGNGRFVAKQVIMPGERQGLGNLIYTFSTHGYGGGSNR